MNETSRRNFVLLVDLITPPMDYYLYAVVECEDVQIKATVAHVQWLCWTSWCY